MKDFYIEDILCDGYDLLFFVYYDEYIDIVMNVLFVVEEFDNFVICFV